MALFDIVLTTDTISISDQLISDGLTRFEVVNDSISVEDSILVEIRARVKKITPITPTKLRVEFGGKTVINSALVNPNNYVISTVTPGAANVVVNFVELPFGQSNPSYVELETSEHTDNNKYNLALSENIIGYETDFSKPYNVNYIGLGESPTVSLVLATAKDQVYVYFSENMKDNSSIRDTDNYIWDGGLQTIEVENVLGNIVVLKTSDQSEGTLYNLTIRGISARKIEDNVSAIDQLSVSVL